jgi:hypothetical protein
VDGYCRAYGSVGVDVDFRCYYESSAVGVFTMSPGGTTTPLPASETQSFNEGTGGTPVPFDYNSAGISQYVLHGYLDVSSISGTPDFNWQFKRGSGTTGTTYLSVAWLRLHWLATT